MRTKLSIKFMVLTSVVVVLGITGLGWVIVRAVESEARSRADHEAQNQVEQLLSNLQTVDDLSSMQVRSAMRVLLREGQQMGNSAIKGTVTVGGKAVPALHLGKSSQAGDFALVDRIMQLTGCKATLFVRSPEGEFIRVSTNVLQPDAEMAVQLNSLVSKFKIDNVSGQDDASPQVRKRAAAAGG